MFALKIHSVDAPKPFFYSSTNFHRSPNRTAQLTATVHFFRNLPSSSTYPSNPNFRTTLLFVVAVPNYFSPDDFLLFCGSYVNLFSEIIILRNDDMQDRYSVLIRFANQLVADGFYSNFNGKQFKTSELEVCHLFFIQSVEITKLANVAGSADYGYTELPTCPLCLERLNQDTSAIQTTLCDHLFQYFGVSQWTYLSCKVCRLCQQPNKKLSCAVCGTFENPWVCIICGFVGCGRYEEGHAMMHSNATEHCYSIRVKTLQIWDYVANKFVHRLNKSKFDSESIMTNICCVEDGTCSCGSHEDSGIGVSLFNTKFEAVPFHHRIVDEYNHLLATQMETQRQLNQEVMKNQVNLQKTFKDIEERMISSMNSKDAMILDLAKQIRDLKVSH